MLGCPLSEKQGTESGHPQPIQLSVISQNHVGVMSAFLVLDMRSSSINIQLNKAFTHLFTQLVSCFRLNQLCLLPYFSVRLESI